LLLGGAATTLTLNPVGAQTAQNDPATMAQAPRPGAPPSFADLVERLQPAVVNISTRQSVQVRQQQLPPGFEEFFRRFGAPVPNGGSGSGSGSDGGGTTTQRGGSLGSGFIISADGYIVTNNHVVAPARPDAVVEQITVTLDDRSEYEAEVVGRDQVADVAVLKINPTRPLPFVRFGDSTRLRVGDWVVAVGDPFGIGQTVTAGIVSALHRNINSSPYDRYIQTDASINSGNSGGPMFDLNGNVVGMNTALISPTGGNVGIGFAIPAEQIRPVVETLRRGERVRRGYIGVSLQPLDRTLANSIEGVPANRGELIRSVTPDGPAARAGIHQGDVIVSVAGQAVTPDQTLSYLVAQQAVGARVPFELVRGGRHMTVTVALGERPSEEELARLNGVDTGDDDDNNGATGKPQAPQPSSEQRSVRDSLGVTVEPLTADIARRLGLRDPSVRGVVVNDVDQNSDAAQQGLRQGDIILSINQRPTTTAAQVAAAVASARAAGRSSVLVLVQRGSVPAAFVGIELARPGAVATPPRR